MASPRIRGRRWPVVEGGAATAQDRTQPLPADRMLRAFSRPGLTWRERVVLSAIAYHCGPNGAWPSMQTLATECGCHRARIAETVASLIGKGVLGKARGRTTNRYWVIDCPGNTDSEKF